MYTNREGISQNHPELLCVVLLSSWCLSTGFCFLQLLSSLDSFCELKFFIQFFFSKIISCSPRYPWTFYVVEEELELLILLPPPPKCRDFRYARRYLLYVVLGIKPRISCTLGKHFTDWAASHTQADSIRHHSESPALRLCLSPALSSWCSSAFHPCLIVPFISLTSET